MKRLVTCVTIDTEADSGPGWVTRAPLSFGSVVSGIPRILRPIFDEYAVKPVYFISPYVADNPRCVSVMNAEAGRGAEIGSHLHGDELKRVVPGEGRKPFACFDYPDAVEYDLIKRMHERIRIRLGIRAISYRAGRFGADNNTLASLRDLGYRVDSSVTPGVSWVSKGGPDFRGYRDQPYFTENGNGSNDSATALLEVPITIGKKRLPFLPDFWFFHRWLRPSHMTVLEMKFLVDDFIKRHGEKELVILCLMFHSMEIIPGASPLVRNALEQRLYLKRLKGILSYIRALGSEFMTLKEIYGVYRGKESE